MHIFLEFHLHIIAVNQFSTLVTIQPCHCNNALSRSILIYSITQYTQKKNNVKASIVSSQCFIQNLFLLIYFIIIMFQILIRCWILKLLYCILYISDMYLNWEVHHCFITLTFLIYHLRHYYYLSYHTKLER